MIIVKTDMTGISLSGDFRHGIPEWYPDIHTWISRVGDTVIVQHPTDPNRKAMRIIFDGKVSVGANRPNFHIFLNEPNTLTEGIQEIWVEAKYFYPTDFHNPLGWFIIAEPFIEYADIHTFDANLYVYPDASGDYLQIEIKRRGQNPDGTLWQENVFVERWNKTVKLPKGKEFTLRWHVKRHPTDGIFEMWLDDEKILDYRESTTESAERWRVIPFDHYCNIGAPVTTNYLTGLIIGTTRGDLDGLPVIPPPIPLWKFGLVIASIFSVGIVTLSQVKPIKKEGVK